MSKEISKYQLIATVCHHAFHFPRWVSSMVQFVGDASSPFAMGCFMEFIIIWISRLCLATMPPFEELYLKLVELG